MGDIAIAMKVLQGAAASQPQNAPILWQAARLLAANPEAGAPKVGSKRGYTVLPMQAEFDYVDDNGLHSHRTVFLLALTDGKDVKRNIAQTPADRYGYLLTGYCTLRKDIRSFRSSRITNLRTFTTGMPVQPNKQWWPEEEKVAS